MSTFYKERYCEQLRHLCQRFTKNVVVNNLGPYVKVFTINTDVPALVSTGKNAHPPDLTT